MQNLYYIFIYLFNYLAIYSIIYLFICSNKVFGQTEKDTSSLFQPKIEELLQMANQKNEELSTQVAGQKNFLVREAPSAITIITDEQLTQWGVTDFMDIFKFVPGFEVNFDIGNAYGLSVRGNWGGEAKILYMIDGIQMNELNYGSVNIGNRFSITAIKKIEIIRGPGSALYGGLAGLAVINIITKTGKEENKVQGSITYSNSQGESLKQITEISLTKKINDDFSIQIHGASHEGKISNRFVNFVRGSANYADSSRIYDRFLNIGMQYKNFRIKGIYDEYKIKRTLDIYAYDRYSDFTGTYLMADYEGKINEKLTISPEVSWKTQEPWNIYGGGQAYYAMIINRFQSMVRMKYAFNKNLEFSGGIEYYNLNSKFKSDTVKFFTGKRSFDIDNIGLFTEVSYQSKYFNVVAGARYDQHSFAGEAFVPRFSLTKAFSKFHYKIMYAEAFKTPIVSNLQLATSPISPENIKYGEIELGYKFNDKMSFVANFFTQNISNSIVFSYASSIIGGYANQGVSNLWGWEGQFNFTSKYFQTFLQYSFYRPRADSDVFRIPNNDQASQGTTPHKITLHTHTRITSKFFITLNSSFFSQRQMYVPIEFQGDDGLRTISEINLIDVVFLWKNVAKKLDIQLYVNDLTNEQFSHSPAYKVDLYPLPAPARTLGARVFWKF